MPNSKGWKTFKCMWQFKSFIERLWTTCEVSLDFTSGLPHFILGENSLIHNGLVSVAQGCYFISFVCFIEVKDLSHRVCVH